MLKKRLIAVLILRDGQVVQSVRFKHTNVIHYDPIHAIDCFNKWAVDEIVLLNVSRDIESRGQFAEIVEKISANCFVPLTVGGWITDEDYAHGLLSNGADKLVVNSILHTEPTLVTSLSNRFGKQCIVASFDIKRDEAGEKSVMVDRGRISTGINPIDWAKQAQALGAGEIFFNSIDHDGARKGYDLETISELCQTVDIPVIAFGGVFQWKHLMEGINAGADAVAVANQFHYTEHSTRKAKRYLAEAGALVRVEGR